MHPEQSISFLLMRVVNRITEYVNQELKSWGLNLLSARVLVSLHLNSATTVGDLASQADVDQSTLSHMLRRMEMDGLLTRARLESDNRAVKVSLTPHGRTAAAQCMRTLQHHDRLLLKTFDLSSQGQLKALLTEILENTICFEERARLLAARREKGRHLMDQIADVS